MTDMLCFALSQFDYRDDGRHLLKGTLSSLPSRRPAPYVLFERGCVRQDKEKDGFKMWWMLHAHVGMTGMPVSYSLLLDVSSMLDAIA